LQVNTHLEGGMIALYTMKPSIKPQPLPALSGVTRTYYIAAKEVLW
jgi:hypothetical protein